MRSLTIPLFLLSLFSYYPKVNAQADEELALFFKLSDYFLKRHVYNGLVNYGYASSKPKEINLLHKTISEVDLTNASDDEKKAYFINSYNLLVIYQVIESYPLKRPLDKDGFFDGMSHIINGERLTLNDLESEKMLRAYEDPRFHFVLACAAMSCPKLYNRAYTSENVNALMEDRTRIVLNDPNFIRVRGAEKEVQLSKIFEWYRQDFQKDGQSVLDYINAYREDKIPSDYRIVYYEYDWTLNERKG